MNQTAFDELSNLIPELEKSRAYYADIKVIKDVLACAKTETCERESVLRHSAAYLTNISELYKSKPEAQQILAKAVGLISKLI